MRFDAPFVVVQIGLILRWDNQPATYRAGDLPNGPISLVPEQVVHLPTGVSWCVGNDLDVPPKLRIVQTNPSLGELPSSLKRLFKICQTHQLQQEWQRQLLMGLQVKAEKPREIQVVVRGKDVNLGFLNLD